MELRIIKHAGASSSLLKTNRLKEPRVLLLPAIGGSSCSVHVSPQQSNPVMKVWKSALDHVAQVCDPKYPIIATTFRVTEHWQAGAMTRNLTWQAEMMQMWDPNRERLYFIYGGYWKARYESPRGIPEPLYHSTNQEPLSTSASVDLDVDDYVFLRPTQSEHVMLQFGDLLVVDDDAIVDRWPVFQQTA